MHIIASSPTLRQLLFLSRQTDEWVYEDGGRELCIGCKNETQKIGEIETSVLSREAEREKERPACAPSAPPLLVLGREGFLWRTAGARNTSLRVL